jgi:hypothetical protein
VTRARAEVEVWSSPVAVRGPSWLEAGTEGAGELSGRVRPDRSWLLRLTATTTSRSFFSNPADTSRSVASLLPARPPASQAVAPLRLLPLRVLMLMTPRKASAPKRAEAGPRTTSIRSTAERGISSGPSQFPPVEWKATE